MATLTVNSTLDSSFSKGNNFPVGGAYSVLHDAATGSIDASAQTIGTQIRGGNSSNNFDNMVRSGFVFDTSALGAGASISAAVFSLVAYAKEETITTQSVSVVGFTPASTASFATSDYAQFGTTLFATDIAIASITADGATYTDWALNASGIAAISLTGKTTFGIRMRSDVNNVAPTWVTNSNGAYIGIQLSASGGTSIDPKLVITYTASSGLSAKKTLLGVGA